MQIGYLWLEYCNTEKCNTSTTKYANSANSSIYVYMVTILIAIFGLLHKRINLFTILKENEWKTKKSENIRKMYLKDLLFLLQRYKSCIFFILNYILPISLFYGFTGSTCGLFFSHNLSIFIRRCINLIYHKIIFCSMIVLAVLWF